MALRCMGHVQCAKRAPVRSAIVESEGIEGSHRLGSKAESGSAIGRLARPFDEGGAIPFTKTEAIRGWPEEMLALLVPIPTKPPVYNGMIAPRDSWMMPPLYNEMIPPGAPRALA
jgi:hypothetical protein